MVNKDKLMEALQKLIVKTMVNFTKKHKLSIKSINIDYYSTTIIENATIMDSPSMTKTYKISNNNLNTELDNG